MTLTFQRLSTKQIQNVLFNEVPKWLHKRQKGQRCFCSTNIKISLYCFFCISFFIFMFEPLLLHLFLLYSSINIMSFIVKTLRKIFSLLFSIDKFSIVLISLFVETISHLYFILQSKSETVGTYSSSLIPLHSLVRNSNWNIFLHIFSRSWWVC